LAAFYNLTDKKFRERHRQHNSLMWDSVPSSNIRSYNSNNQART